MRQWGSFLFVHVSRVAFLPLLHFFLWRIDTRITPFQRFCLFISRFTGKYVKATRRMRWQNSNIYGHDIQSSFKWLVSLQLRMSHPAVQTLLLSFVQNWARRWICRNVDMSGDGTAVARIVYVWGQGDLKWSPRWAHKGLQKGVSQW